MDTTHGTGGPAESTDPDEAWAPPVPGTAYATVGAPSAAAPVATPAADPWTSPLWGRPDTVGGSWPSPDSTERIVVPPAGPPTAPARHVSRGLVAAVATVIVAMLIGFGVVKAIPHDDAAVAPPPTSSAPAVAPSDPAPSDPAQSDPNQGLLPSQDPQTQPSQGSGSTGSSSATADPAVVAAVAPSIVNITTTVGYDGGQAPAPARS